jgi:hypothetical protein
VRELEMSKVHSKDNSLFNDIASTTIAGQLGSRLRELERNIAVAHEFIKLADESYNQVKHEWELLQDDKPSTKKTPEFPSQSQSQHDDEDTFEDITSFKDKKTHGSHEKSSKNLGSNSHTPSLGAKLEATKKKETPEPAEAKTSEPEPKESKTSRHKKSKNLNSKN